MPPIATSSSCSTLVSLDEDVKTFPPLTAEYSIDSPIELESTDIRIVREDSFEETESLLLPRSDAPVFTDEYLGSIPSIASRADELLSVAPRVFTEASQESIVNICQGEIAHVTSSDCDAIVSTDATTCHIVAVRSYCEKAKSAPLTSLTHIDRAGYESCIRKMFEMHRCHHSNHSRGIVDLDLHVVGGFNDEQGSSREISTFLFRLFEEIATEERNRMRITLRTCAISIMNDNGYCAPIARGFALDTVSGEGYLADVDRCVAGPAIELRACRLWSGCSHTLNLVHLPRTITKSGVQSKFNGTITVQPFSYKPFREIDALIRLPDHILLQHTSTSPHCECDNFCDNLRRTLYFLKTVQCTKVFGTQCNTPLSFRRVNRNEWVVC